MRLLHLIVVLIGRVLSFQIVNLFCEIEIVLGFDYRVLPFSKSSFAGGTRALPSMLAPDFSTLSNAVFQLSNHFFAIARAKLIHIGKQNCSGIERTVEILQRCSPPRRARGELNLKLAHHCVWSGPFDSTSPCSSRPAYNWLRKAQS